MKAMILAAGKGTRVRPLTNKLPKPMIPLVRKPIMESIVEHLAHHGFDQIFVNTSYLSHRIEDYFRDGDRWGVQMAYSFEGSLNGGVIVDDAIGSAGGMRKIQDQCGFFDDVFLVLCGDALIDIDLSAVLAQHRASGAIATIVTRAVPREEVSKYGVVVSDDTGRVLRFQEKPRIEEAASTQINTGIYIFDPRIFDFIPSKQSFDIGGHLFPALVAAGEPIHSVGPPFQWVDVGSIADFWNATSMALNGEINGFKLPGTEVLPGVRFGMAVRANLSRVSLRGPIYIGSSTSIGDGAVIEGPVCIGSNCVIDGDARIRKSVIGDYTHVSAIADIDERIVVAGKFIDPYGQAIDIDESDIGWVVGDSRASYPSGELYDDLRAAAQGGGGPR
jgi:mannose-1-phosphate guanylyltransferase